MIIESLLSQSKSKAPISQVHSVVDLVDDIITLFDEKAILELCQGNESDIDKVMETLFEETFQVVTSQNRILDPTALNYIPNLSQNVEETLRFRIFNYFILSVLPDFILGWHNLEWGNLTQMYRLLCVLAARDHGKCLSQDTLVVMSDGRYKKISEVEEGDLLMGPDSKPRKVLNKYNGRGKLYRVNQSRGSSYVVNDKHILSLYKKWTNSETKDKHCKLPTLVDIEIEDFIKSSKDFKNLHKGYKVCTSFPHKEVTINPYYLGLWLGDGTQSEPSQITTKDTEIHTFLKEYGGSIGLKFIYKEKEIYCKLSVTNQYRNPLNTWFKQYKLTDEKHIPEDYLYNSEDIRMSVLAGLADSDGSMEDNQLIITQSVKHRRLIQDIQKLCFSLGLHCIETEEKSTLNGKKFPQISLKICGEKLKDLPVLLERKKIKDTGKSNSMFRRPKLYIGDNTEYHISNVSTIKIEENGIGDYTSLTIDGDKRFLLYDNTVVHNSYEWSFAYPLWQMYRYLPYHKKDRPLAMKETGALSPMIKELNLAREGMLVTNEYGLARHLMEIIKTEIDSNEILKNALKPKSTRETKWGSDHIMTKKGSEMVIKSANSKIRGYHPTWFVLDDFLNDSSIYSQDQRDKYWGKFSGVILPALSPGGQMIVVGTPFFEQDLYYQLKQTGIFKVFEYPAIFPDGTLLFPERHTYKSLMEKKDILGSLIFSREILVKPITEDATIFPYSILRNAIKGGESRKLYTNIDNINRSEFIKVAVGCDFAISSNIGSDYSCFTIGGLDKYGKIHIFNSWRRKGASYSEQIAVLKKINRDFLPDVMYVENNNFQEVFVQMMKDENLPVVGKTTGANKKSLYMGVPRLATFFETNRILFPYNSQRDRDVTDLYFSELNSISFIQDTGKLESLTQHDDTSMSLWNLCRALLGDKLDFNFSFM